MIPTKEEIQDSLKTVIHYLSMEYPTHTLDRLQNIIERINDSNQVQKEIAVNIEYKRPSDMNPNETLGIFIEDDNDVIVTIYNEEKGTSQVQFCTSVGGGKSLETRKALIGVAKAIIRDSDQIIK